MIAGLTIQFWAALATCTALTAGTQIAQAVALEAIARRAARRQRT